MQHSIAILGAVILPTFESLETYTPEEFLLFCRQQEEQGDLHRYELLEGRILMNPPAGWPHGSIENNIAFALTGFVRSKGLGRVFGSSQGYRLPSADVLEPDVGFVFTARLEAMPKPVHGEFLRVVPDFVVEILSDKTRSRDLDQKRHIYAKNGVREYWIVDSRNRRVTILVAEDGSYREDAIVEAGGTAVSKALAGFEMAFADVFDGV